MMAGLNTGYPALSRLMGKHAGLGMFKRFAALNMRNLLYMQAELLRKENELEALSLNDNNEPARRGYKGNARKLTESLSSLDPIASQQWRKMLEIRALLNEYSRTLKNEALHRAKVEDRCCSFAIRCHLRAERRKKVRLRGSC